MSFNSRKLAKLLRNRPHARGVEVGVFKGDTSRGLLEALPGLEKLICVDLWAECEEFKAHCPNKTGLVYNADWAQVRQQFTEQVLKPYRGRVLPMQMRSVHAAEMLPNNSLDFGFIDGNHGKPYVLEDVRAWWPKIKEGGLLAGDDYQNKPTYGVIEAVQELFGAAHSNMGRIWFVHKNGITLND